MTGRAHAIRAQRQGRRSATGFVNTYYVIWHVERFVQLLHGPHVVKPTPDSSRKAVSCGRGAIGGLTYSWQQGLRASGVHIEVSTYAQGFDCGPP